MRRISPFSLRGRASPLALALPLALAACSGDSAEATPPKDLAVGGFHATVGGACPKVDVVAHDGRKLLEGLCPGSIPADGPPLVGFAVRDVATTYEMKFGAFEPTDAAHGPWRGAASIDASASDGAATLVLHDAAGAKLASLKLTEPEPGHLRAEVEPGDGPERRFSWGFRCAKDDHFMGFGAQTFDVDHRGQTVPTFVQEEGIGKTTTDDYDGAWYVVGRRHSSQIPIPEFFARRGYELAVETDLRATFALCSEREDGARLEFELPAVVDVFDGPSPTEAIERATATLGRPRTPPRAAYAPWNDAIFGSDNVRRVAKKLRDNGIPSSVIWTEDWRGGEWKGDAYRLNEEWEVDTTLYPDFPALASDLHGEGYQFYVYFNPFVEKGSKAWSEAEPKGYLIHHEDGTTYTFTDAKFRDASLVDLDNGAARAWAEKKMTDAVALGADGWMADYGEWMPTDAVTAAGPSLPRHDTYPVAWQKANREALDATKDGVERLMFVRSGWFGTPPLADVVWAGDQRTTMDVDDGLPTILPIGIGLGVVGISTYGHDIAGYQSATNPPSTKEVFFRWTELGAWSPVMRTHHGTNPKLEWSWESDDETIAHYRRYAKLHMALVPYLEGLAKVASETGLPIWRGLALRFPEDEAVWPITDEVLVGDGVLVAPVMTPGATSRSVYLPAGRWFPWGGGAAVDGGAKTTAAAPMGEIPVYARAGAVVPTWPDGVMTVVNASAGVPGPESVGDDRVVYAFLGDDGHFEEASGLAYTLDHVADAAGAPSLSWNGASLAACADPAVAPCASIAADGATAHVAGPGTLVVSRGGTDADRLTVDGGAKTRALTLVLRY